MSRELKFREGVEGEHDARAIADLREQLCDLKQRISVAYGAPSKDVRKLPEILGYLDRPEGSGFYLRLAEREAQVNEERVQVLQVSLESAVDDLKAGLLSVDPDFSINPTEIVEAAVSHVDDAAKPYFDRLTLLQGELVAIQARIQERIRARHEEGEPQQASGNGFEVKYYHKEGSPGTLSDGVDPAGLRDWLQRFKIGRAHV